jgi:hypothetical protein
MVSLKRKTASEFPAGIDRLTVDMPKVNAKRHAGKNVTIRFFPRQCNDNPGETFISLPASN